LKSGIHPIINGIKTMKKLIKAAVLGLATFATVLPALAPAHAGDWDRRYYRRDHGRHYNDNSDAWALGAAGLATGLIVGGAIASQPRYQERVYIDPEPEYYEPAPVYRRPRPVVVDNGYGLEPWSPAWYDYCERRYRSFNARTGTFRGYDGRDYFCQAG
jgi:hypothetical protein